MSLSESELKALLCMNKTKVDVADTSNLLKSVFDMFPGRVAVISSFGAESAVLLAQVAKESTNIPIYFLDTGWHFPETLSYRDDLINFFHLKDVRVLHPDAIDIIEEDPHAQLVNTDPDACCDLRKVRPLQRVIGDFDIWITGRKRMQSKTRAGLPVVEPQADGTVKLNPLAGWDETDISTFMKNNHIPPHPLVAQGYRSIGCAPCTRPVHEGEDSRSGRWAGRSKTECGIHKPVFKQ